MESAVCPFYKHNQMSFSTLLLGLFTHTISCSSLTTTKKGAKVLFKGLYTLATFYISVFLIQTWKIYYINYNPILSLTEQCTFMISNTYTHT